MRRRSRRQVQEEAGVIAKDLLLRGLVEPRHVLTQLGDCAGELRCATRLARLQRDRGHHREARELLASLYDRFTVGFGTADLQTAKRLLDELDDVALPRRRRIARICTGR